VTRDFSDVLSGARDDRPSLTALMDYVRDDDTVVVWKLDRLGRDLAAQILKTVEGVRLEQRELESRSPRLQ
jgi:DNA invertase Pin-like site-specific DNA recombinase